MASIDRIGRVVIFGHADPFSYKDNRHIDFFGPLTEFIRDDIGNQLPIAYVNGDKHSWLVEPNFYGQSSFLRVMVDGGDAPPIKITVNWDDPYTTDPDKAFTIDRRL
jgi:hypothetical protein